MQLLPHAPQQVGVSVLHDGQRASLYAGSVRCERCIHVNVIRAHIRPSRIQTTAMRHEKKP